MATKFLDRFNLEALIKKHFLLLLIIIINLVVHIPKLNKRLNEIDGFRQTQTALGIKSFLRESLNPFNATLPIAGPKSQIPFEFPLFQLIASFPAQIFTNLDVAARLTGLVSFLATAVLVYLIGLKFWGIKVATVAALIFSFSSFSLQWGSSSLIEFTATGLILSSILVLKTFLENENKRLLLLVFLVLLTLGFTVKITTAITWFIVVIAIIWLKLKKIKKITIFLLVSTISTTALLTGLWTRWADRRKLEQEFWGPGLTSQALRDWNFGTLAMRFNPENIFERLQRISDPTVGSSAILLALVIVSFLRFRADLVTASLAGAIVLGPVIFFPLYGHLYYAAALLPAISLIAGVAVVNLAGKKIAIYSLAFLLIGASYSNQLGKYYLESHFKRPGLHDVSRHIYNRTDQNSVVMLRCNDDWSSEYLYYADRDGLMLRYNDIIPNEKEWGSTYQYLAFCNEGNVDLAIVPSTVSIEKKTKLLFKIYRN